jgi:hypothetical protein
MQRRAHNPRNGTHGCYDDMHSFVTQQVTAAAPIHHADAHVAPLMTLHLGTLVGCVQREASANEHQLHHSSKSCAETFSFTAGAMCLMYTQVVRGALFRCRSCMGAENIVGGPLASCAVPFLTRTQGILSFVLRAATPNCSRCPTLAEAGRLLGGIRSIRHETHLCPNLPRETAEVHRRVGMWGTSYHFCTLVRLQDASSVITPIV